MSTSSYLDSTLGFAGEDPCDSIRCMSERLRDAAMTPDGVGANFRETLDELPRLSIARLELPDLIGQVAKLAVRAIPRAEAAGIVVQRESLRDAQVATVEWAERLQEVEHEVGEGPSVTALRERRPVGFAATVAEQTWPRLAPHARAFGVHSVLALPLVMEQDVFGVLSMYAREPNVFDDRAVELGQLFAAPAAIAVHNARALAAAVGLAENLRAALVSRPVIDQAIGILMSRTGASAQEAFDRLRVLSQAENRKVSVIAHQIVEEAVRRARARHGEIRP